MTTAQQRPRRGGGGRRRRVCLCKEATIDYKEVSLLRRMLTDRGRMESAKKSGNCAKCQRQVRLAIQQARFLGLLPFSNDHIRVTSVISSPHAEAEDDGELGAEEYDDAEDSDEAEPGAIPASSVASSSQVDEEDDERLGADDDEDATVDSGEAESANDADDVSEDSDGVDDVVEDDD